MPIVKVADYYVGRIDCEYSGVELVEFGGDEVRSSIDMFVI